MGVCFENIFLLNVFSYICFLLSNKGLLQKQLTMEASSLNFILWKLERGAAAGGTVLGRVKLASVVSLGLKAATQTLLRKLSAHRGHCLFSISYLPSAGEGRGLRPSTCWVRKEQGFLATKVTSSSVLELFKTKTLMCHRWFQPREGWAGTKQPSFWHPLISSKEASLNS